MKRKAIAPISSIAPSKRRRLVQSMESIAEHAAAVVAQHTTAMPNTIASFKVSVLKTTLQKCGISLEVREALDASCAYFEAIVHLSFNSWLVKFILSITWAKPGPYILELLGRSPDRISFNYSGEARVI